MDEKYPHNCTAVIVRATGGCYCLGLQPRFVASWHPGYGRSPGDSCVTAGFLNLETVLIQ